MSDVAETSEQINETVAPLERGRVLVTGASGFVGRYTLRQLVIQGYEPVCVVRNAEKLKAKLSASQRLLVHPVQGSLFDTKALSQAAEGCVAAVHLVGIIYEQPLAGQTFQRVHVEGTRAVVDACEKAGVKRYAHMSALGSRAQAVSAYHQSKWDAEEIVRASSLDWTIFRPSVIHGYDGEFMEMMKFFSTSKFLQPVMPYFGKGDKHVQPIDVRDVACCFARSLHTPETIGKAYELGGPVTLNWKELYDTCALAIAGKKRIKVSVPVPVAKFLAKAVMPLAPSVLVPYKFNEGQIQMSQEDSVCDIKPVEEAFGLKLRDFRTELKQYADMIQ